jgi:hypothetical protein
MGGTRASEDADAITVATASAAADGRSLPQPLLGRYLPGRRLGSGGFGTVYEAEDLRLGRAVALKVMDVSASSPERARREALAVARLDHPGIVAVFDAGEAGATRYLVSELVRGRTLAELEAEDVLSDRDMLRVGLALADALAHAHARGVVHRDVKPQNVIVPDAGDETGEGTWRSAAKLADFGVASLAGDESLTQTGDIVGTLAYMAPEQASGGRVDDRADLYALALVLYEAFSGAHPVRAGSPAATARRVGTVLPSLCRHRRDLPRAVCAAIDVALDPDPERRGGLDELADALAGALTEVSDDGGTIAPHPLERARRRLPRGVGRMAAAAAAGGLVGLALLTHAPDATPSPGMAAAGIALLTAALPRAGWLAGLGVVLAALVASPPSASGLAAVVALAAVGVVLLLPDRGLTWSLPAVAPLLGAASLAFAYPALAGRAGSLRVRAALGALGALWLLLAGPVTGEVLWFGSTGVGTLGTHAPAAAVAERVLAPLVTSGAVALIPIWAVAAAVLPWAVRGRSRAADAMAAILWGAALVCATVILCDPAGKAASGALVELAGGGLAGAVVAAWRRG